MTARTVQRNSNSSIQQNQAQLKAAQMRPKFDAGISFFEPIGDRWVDHHSAPDDKSADRKNLKIKLLRIKNAAALSWQPPRLPQAFQVTGIATMTHVPTGECIMLRDLVETTNSPPLRLRQNVTGCSVGSAALLEVESPVLMLQKSDSKFLQVPAQLSPNDRLWVNDKSKWPPAVTSDQPGMSCRDRRC